jgi:hypothetical protein
MKLFIRPADLLSERDALAAVLERNLPDFDHRRRFQWLYLDNPAGPAWCWFLCAEGDRVVGAASLFPRYLWMSGRLVRCGQVGDFAVDAAHRSLGPALMLQKATMTPATEGVLEFCYDCPPHENGMATFRRMGIAATCGTARFVKLLGITGLARRYFRLPRPMELPLTFVSAVLGVLDRAHRLPAGMTLETLPAEFNETFTELDLRLSQEHRDGIRARKQKDDLNWRFRRDPLRQYEVTVARQGMELVGYAVAWPRTRTLRLVEMVWKSPEVCGALARALAENARAAGYEAVDTIASPTSSEASGLRASGFREREPAERVVVFGQSSARDGFPAGAEWHLWASDVMA